MNSSWYLVLVIFLQFVIICRLIYIFCHENFADELIGGAHFGIGITIYGIISWFMWFTYINFD